MLTKRLQRIGNSIGLVLPRDLVHAADLREGDEVTITLHGRRIVLEPSTRFTTDEEFESGFTAVLERHGEAFRQLAQRDRQPRRAR